MEMDWGDRNKSTKNSQCFLKKIILVKNENLTVIFENILNVKKSLFFLYFYSYFMVFFKYFQSKFWK